MRYLLINIVLVFLFNHSAYSRANDAPVVTCLEVHEAGDVTIYWQSLDLTALEFNIFYSIDNVTWLSAGSVDTLNSSLSFHHTFAQANNQQYYYYITAIYPNGDEVSSDIFSTIFLVVDNSTAGVALLLWNYVHSPLPQGSSSYYKIYMSVYDVNPPVDWVLVDSVENTLYNYTIEDGLCYDSINFKIEIDNSFSCSSVSNIAGDWFSEVNPPDKPTFDSISIIDNSYAILGWEPSVSTDAWGTVIYRHDGSTWPTIDTIFGNNVTHYIDSSYSACVENHQYAIAAFDSCGNVSPGTFSSPLRPIFLYDISYNLCSETNSLSWEAYINASPPLEKYEIWSIKNNGDTILIGETLSSIQVYNHTGVDNATDYSYFVKAIFGSFSSTSCIKTIRTGDFIKPDSLFLANANVLIDYNIELTLDVDLKPTTCTWEILRSDAGGGPQSLLTTLERNQVTTSTYNYLDETADGSTGYYTYSVNVYDSCGALTLQSNTIKTIYLAATQLSDNENYLTWNELEGFDGGVDKYYIFRMLGSVVPTLPIDSTNAQTTEYIDNTTTVDAAESKISYWVQAAEGSANSFGYQVKSNSNIIDLFRETEMYLPNAFRPLGVNTIFKPVATGFGGSNYLFQIYNRWGQLIFESTDYDHGWDGTYKGKPSQQGAYVYRLVYQNVFDETKQQQGTVMLID